MEEKNTSIFYNGLIWGVIVGLLGVIYSVILYVTDQFLNQALGIISLVILIGGLAYSTYYFREQVRGGILSFGQAFSFGIVVAVTYALIGQIYYYIQVAVIDPGIQEKMLEMAMEKMLDRGVPEDQMDQVMSFTRRLSGPVFTTVTGFFSVSVMGIVLALITSAIFKKDEPA
jgi:hypothetical protein